MKDDFYQTYGTKPKTAIDDGRERTPSETDWAIITMGWLAVFHGGLVQSGYMYKLHSS